MRPSDLTLTRAGAVVGFVSVRIDGETTVGEIPTVWMSRAL